MKHFYRDTFSSHIAPQETRLTAATRCFSTQEESGRSSAAGETQTTVMYIIQPHIKKTRTTLLHTN